MIEYGPGLVALSYGIFLPPFAEFAEPKALVALAQSAEVAGWDGFFLWDHVLEGSGLAVADSFVMTAAIAQATRSCTPRHARHSPCPAPSLGLSPGQTATLDLLSEGRLVVGVGLGHDNRGELSSFTGEVLDPLERVAVLDESLELLKRFWSGEPVAFDGEHLRVHSAAFLPRPLQRPLPVWVACRSPYRRPSARAARFQGCFRYSTRRIGDPGLPARTGRSRPCRADRARSPRLDRHCLPGRESGLEASGEPSPSSTSWRRPE